MKGLVLISCPGSQHQEGRVLELAGWMGVAARKVTVGDRPTLDRLLADLGGEDCVALSTETLAFLRELSPPGVLQDFIHNRCAKLLVFSLGGSLQHEGLLSWLTSDAVTGLTSPEARQVFEAPESARRFSCAFAGQSFALMQAVPVSTFDLRNRDSPGVEKILLADQRPVFLRMERGSCELFLLALAQLPDINERLSQNRGVEEYYDQLIPLLIFIRHCFGEMCWHGPERTARLIIDDPLLNKTYGFLDYGALQTSMRSAGYGTSIAFIPWNYWRTTKTKAAKIFCQKPNLSICVHGCDHTNREFGEVDLGSLQWKADTALRRMERHRTRTGLAFDPIMVFPQGRFSTSAMLALRTNGYLAAVNTTCFPTDAGVEPLTIAHFLRPAITRFHGFPLFQRRYPRRLIDFAFDVFLGRPALLVQHHEDFRDGYQRLEEFVNGLHKLEPKLTWGGLSCQLMQSCMMRSLSEHSIEVRFFTRHFRFKNAQPTRTSLVFTKEEPDASAISSVVVDGISVPFSFRNEFLTFEHEVDAGQVVEVRIVDRVRAPSPTRKRLGVTHTVGVSVRRALSEFRDNTLARFPRLLTAATELATRMKVTGVSARKERT
jgi:hypothetical protein